MADISKCKGIDCPLKETCYRFTAPVSERQSWFIKPPYADNKCEMYWGGRSSEIMNQLVEICKPKCN